MLPVITVPAAPIRKQYFFHGVYIVFFCFGRFKNIQCSSQISDIFFHKIRIISPADQFQVCDARFLKAIKCTKTAAACSGEIARIVFCRNFCGRCFLSRNVIPVLCCFTTRYIVIPLLSVFYACKQIRHTAKISHLIAVKGITECTGKLAEFIQSKCLELKSAL